MRFFVALLAFAHGLIHFIGFLKAYKFLDLSEITNPISRFLGLFWLLPGILFVTAALFSLLKFAGWPLLMIIAVIFSQILIILSWTDAKYGTIANILLLMISLPDLGKYNFEKRTASEIHEIINHKTSSEEAEIAQNELKTLPPIVHRWLDYSGVTEGKNVQIIHLFQKGEMRTKPAGKWMPFTAEEYFNAQENSFLWKAEVQMIPGIFLSGRDKLNNGRASMLIKLMSLFPIVKEEDNYKANSGAMIRYLGEICWFPSAALNRNITWKNFDDFSAEAVLQQNDIKVSGIFHFSEEGELLSFEAERYFGAGADSKKEKWLVETEETKDFHGIRIPSKSKVTWKLPNGDFHWLSLEITDIHYR